MIKVFLSEAEANLILEVAKELGGKNSFLAPKGKRVGAAVTVDYWKGIAEKLAKQLCVK